MNRKYVLPLFLILQIVGIKCLAFVPEFVETYYSTGIYPWISKISRTSFGWISFSIGDIFYALLILWSIRWLWKFRKQTWKTKLLQTMSAAAVVYFLFHMLWAFNYYRLPLFEKMHLKREYTEAQLLTFTQKIIAKTNAIQLAITKDTALKVTNPYTDREIFTKSQNGYTHLAQEYPFFNYTNPSTKASLFSYPLTYMGFGGYLNPFTNEAQVNNLPPKYNFPATTCHEMAHQMGFASESECNFIGFLAATHNDDPYFKYAGYSFALRYCLATIGANHEDQMKNLLKTIHPGVLKNFQESEDFWMAHRTFIDTAFEVFYDHFLKMNQQQDGMESYSKFLDLLVNYDLEKRCEG